jgi:Ca2+-binding RTX toxin-like protein
MFHELKISNFNTVGGEGYDFGGSDYVQIDYGVLIGATESDGVYSGSIACTLYNLGDIFSGNGTTAYGALFDLGTYSKIYNEATGSITGMYRGLGVFGDNSSTVNVGHIATSGDTGAYFSGSSNNLSNFGDIYGHSAGVSTSTVTIGDTIYNAGQISSDLIGVAIGALNPGLTTSITNTATGHISGGEAAIATSGFGAIALDNLGTIDGGVNCLVAGAADTITNHGTINGIVRLFSGNDVFNGRGGTSGDIFCGGGNDLVTAGIGDVRIHVGSGHSTLTGGPGHDQFVFDSALGSGVVRITNYRPHLDKIALSATDLAGIGPIGHTLAAIEFHLGVHAATHQQRIIYNPASGFLYYDPDGSGHLPQIHFATLSHHPALSLIDFVVEA